MEASNLPSWQDQKAGGKARAALWLATEVGEGHVFTKAQLRKAFPDVAQIDRRVRELRDYGWRIDTSRDDPALKQMEQRYVSEGAKVWLPGQAKVAKSKGSLTSAQRHKVWQADNYLCRTCGIGVGESYGDDIELSKLNVARRKVLQPDGTVEVQFVTECKRCGAGSGDRNVDLGALLGRVEALAPIERKILASWIEADLRTTSALEKLWGIFRTLPEESRASVARAVTGMDV
ncbi:hypothetical protein C8250_021010 [Streptomyces sp. So13.3]|uniref:hypothetical protein n=1 Tax=Streptomyces TaxID=1883 RepID=UPI0011069E1D|nr:MULTISPECIES: hypothetical protein [Streptomyces]QNA74061.1 hypothetical protein C8250_021010 [Streptomyces sp. So13.3]